MVLWNDRNICLTQGAEPKRAYKERGEWDSIKGLCPQSDR